MDLIALILSGLSFVVAVVGTVLSNRRSSEAIQESRKSTIAVYWTDVQEAIQRLFGFDPAREPVDERLANLRIACIALVDELDWPGLDTWLEAERVLGATIAQQVMAQARPGETADQMLTRLDPYMRWTHLLSQNLRFARARGQSAVDFVKLRESAVVQTKAVCAANGWPLPRGLPDDY